MGQEAPKGQVAKRSKRCVDHLFECDEHNQLTRIFKKDVVQRPADTSNELRPWLGVSFERTKDMAPTFALLATAGGGRGHL